MTTEEIKQNITMKELLGRYGIKVRNNMCSCPFHGKDKHPSMKVFKDGANCFTCGWNGDLFKFVQDIEHCDFKQAFILLGGTYEHETGQKGKMLGIKYKREREKRDKETRFQQDFKLLLSNAITKCRFIIMTEVAYSDRWCAAYKALESLTHAWDEEYIEKESVDKADVFRIIRRIK